MKHKLVERIAARAFAWLSLVCVHEIANCTLLMAVEPPPIPIPIPVSRTASYSDAIEAHMGYVTEHALDEYGEVHTPMWLSTIDIRTSRLPEPHLAATGDVSGIQSAVSNLYLDQPTIVAAFELARRTGCKCYSDAATAYLRACLKVHEGGVTHVFSLDKSSAYDVLGDRLMVASAEHDWPTTFTPAWETLWEQAPDECERAIRANATDLTKRSLNQSSSSPRGTRDFASDAVVIDSLGWLASKTRDPQQQLRSLARKLADETVPPGNPTGQIGVWVESLIRATRYTGDPTFQNTATRTLNGWLEQHRDARGATTYFSKPSFTVTSTDRDRTGLEPNGKRVRFFEDNSDLRHPHLMTLAEACLSSWEATREEAYRMAVTHWADTLRDSLTLDAGRGADAEDYGRVIHFLVRASDSLHEPQWRELALAYADEAMNRFYEPKLGMFRSRIGVDRCDASDGPGFLVLALLYLDGPDPTSDSALHF